MKFNIITIFPAIFDAYFNASILKRAQEKELISINIYNARDYATDKHRTTDDTPYGGGAGMVMKVEPIYRAVQDVLNVESVVDVQNVQDVEDIEIDNYNNRSNRTIKTPRTSRTIGTPGTRIVLFSAKGKKYTQRDTERLSKYDNLILICGRYEGVDERVAEYLADEEISIGDYVLTGGEIPAMVLVDSIARLLPGVLGNEESFQKESHAIDGYLEHAQYTKPEEFFPNDGGVPEESGWKVPEVLLSGHHSEIEKWRHNNAGKNI